jgi:hypothetical protein
MRVFVGEESIYSPYINGVGIGSGSSTFAHSLESFEEVSGGEGNISDIGVVSLWLGVSALMRELVRKKKIAMWV